MRSARTAHPLPPSRGTAALLRVLVAGALALLASSCVWNVASPGVVLATNPPGARVVVNGHDTGFATPCHVDLNRADRHEVEFHLAGYAVAKRRLEPSETWDTVLWKDGDIGLSVWRFPIFLTFRGLFFPFRQDDNLAPQRIYVPLEVATEGG